MGLGPPTGTSTPAGSNGPLHARPSGRRYWRASLPGPSGRPRPRNPGTTAMIDLPTDQSARDRFTNEWGVNLAVAANAGSGKTTAISERVAAMTLSAEGADMLRQTGVVAYTKKAADQIEQRARSVLLRRMAAGGRRDAEALARLDRAFFGTIHSFCLLLARRHGSTLGINLNPTLVEEEGEDACWQEFLEQDPMAFPSLSASQVASFLRHASLDGIFNLAQVLDLNTESLAAVQKMGQAEADSLALASAPQVVRDSEAS